MSSYPPERVKWAYIGLCAFAFIVAIRLALRKSDPESAPEERPDPAASFTLEVLQNADLVGYRKCFAKASPETDLDRLTMGLVAVERICSSPLGTILRN